jgi:hypothetical protein
MSSVLDSKLSGREVKTHVRLLFPIVERPLLQQDSFVCVAVFDYRCQVSSAALVVSKNAKTGQAETSAYHEIPSQQEH